MNIRYAVSFLLIAVGVLLLPFPFVAVVIPGAKINIGVRLVVGSLGVLGVVFLAWGVRLRRKTIAESPELQVADVSQPVVAMPSFLKPHTEKLKPATQPQNRHLLYWFAFVVFSLAILGLIVFNWNVMAFGDWLFAVSVLVMMFIVLVQLAMPRKP